jgi:hypothetical protein
MRPPYGPNCTPGGNGTQANPGIRWWLEFLRETYGPYKPHGLSLAESPGKVGNS